MALAVVTAGARIRVLLIDSNFVLFNGSTLHVVQMAIMQIIDMAFMDDSLMATGWAMGMRMIFAIRHEKPPWELMIVV